jgi:hypothetical protein
MNLLKRFLLLAVSTAVLLFAVQWTVNAFGIHHILTALLINWLVMSWVAVLGQGIHFYFPEGYYEIKTFERNGRVYEGLGIQLFKKLVRRGPLTLFNPTIRRQAGKDIADLEPEMKKAETGHAIIFVLVSMLALYALINGWIDTAGWLMLFNVFINGYPVMLQRYNRIRLHQKPS